MYAEAELDEYLDEIRERVCSRCVERPPGGPPCAPLGKMCGVELHLPLYVEAVHGVESNFIEPYLDNIHESVCSQCVQHDAKGCPCPLEYLPILVVQAIETVDQRRRQDRAHKGGILAERKGQQRLFVRPAECGTGTQCADSTRVRCTCLPHAKGPVAEAMTRSPNVLDTIAEEHESLANLYERILEALRAAPGELLPASTLLDELVERISTHFAHEEHGGYYSHVVEVAPWRIPAVNELKRQHADLLRIALRIAQGARMANESLLWCEAVRKEFNEFLRRCVEHEARENRLVQEIYVLDIAASD